MKSECVYLNSHLQKDTHKTFTFLHKWVFIYTFCFLFHLLFKLLYLNRMYIWILKIFWKHISILFKDLIVLLISFWNSTIENSYTCSFRIISLKMYFKKYNLFSMHPKTKYAWHRKSCFSFSLFISEGLFCQHLHELITPFRSVALHGFTHFGLPTGRASQALQLAGDKRTSKVSS